ncbi:MAG: NPCBM/NEW2 domain-containing protein [Pirellulaceae bacterium]|nr:NPCBM/NEW2 domain-containing protein [Planctomycetales bacterium]
MTTTIGAGMGDIRDILAIDDDWKISVTESRRNAFDASEVLLWGCPVEVRQGVCLFLTDHTELICRQAQIAAGRATVESELWGQVVVPMQHVAGIVLASAASIEQRETWWRQLTDHATIDDVVMLQNGDLIEGLVTKIATDHVELLEGERRVRLDLASVIGVLWHREAPAVATEQCRGLVGLRNGDVIHAASLHMDESELRVLTTAGLKFETSLENIASHPLAFLQPCRREWVFLSDLSVASARHIPFLEDQWPTVLDQNLEHHSLRANGYRYFKGISVHSASRLIYDVPPDARQFAAEIAIDDSSDGLGSVVFRVLLQGADDQWREAVASSVVRGHRNPQAIVVELDKTKRLALVVDPADWGDQGDHADWLNARFRRLILSPLAPPAD